MLASLACAPRRLACRYWAGRVALRETARVSIVPQVPDEVKWTNDLGPDPMAAGTETFRVRQPTIFPSYRFETWVGWCSVAPCARPARPRAPGRLGQRARGVVSLHLRTLAREGRMTVTI